MFTLRLVSKQLLVLVCVRIETHSMLGAGQDHKQASPAPMPSCVQNDICIVLNNVWKSMKKILFCKFVILHLNHN